MSAPRFLERVAFACLALLNLTFWTAVGLWSMVVSYFIHYR